MNRTELVSSLRGWTGFTDVTVFPDALFHSWIAMAEERISREMRCADMIQIDTANITEGRVELPDDWRAADFVRVVDDKPLRYLSRDEFYTKSDTTGYFTISGLYLIVGGEPSNDNQIQVEMHYFGDVPALGDDAETWVSTRYLTVLTAGAMVFAHAKMQDTVEEDKWERKFLKYIDDVNTEYRRSIASGSKLNRKPPRMG